MPISFYTGSFTFIPPKPFLIDVSSRTGHAKDIISITGENLDYVNTVFLENDICEFQNISQNSLEFTVPDNPNTGFIEITNKEFFPLRGPDVIFATGVDPQFSIFLENNNNLMLYNVYQNNIYQKDSIYLSKIKETGINNLVIELSVNPFKNEAVNLEGIIYTGEINSGSYQVYSTGIINGQYNYFIPLKSNFSDPYITIVNKINTGDGFYVNFTSGQTANGFYFNFSDYLNENITLNIGAYKTGFQPFDAGYHFANYYDITGSGTYFGIKYPNNIELDPDVQILTDISTTTNISTPNFYVSKIYEINTTGFFIGLSKNIVDGDTVRINYLAIKNSGEALQAIKNKLLASNESSISENKIDFYPVAEVRSINPLTGPSGATITLTGISFRFITGVEVSAVPLFDDIEYILGSGTSLPGFKYENIYTRLRVTIPYVSTANRFFRRPTVTYRDVPVNSNLPANTIATRPLGPRNIKQMLNFSEFVIGNSLKSGNNQVTLNQIINTNLENSYFKITQIRDFDFISGRPIFLSGQGVGQKFYEHHIYNFSNITGTGNKDLQTFTSGLQFGSNSYFIDLPTGFKPSGINSGNYSPFYTIAFTGEDKEYYSFISGKSSSGFFINFNKNLNYDINLNCLLINNINTGFDYDNGIYLSSGISIPSISTGIDITFANDFLFKPFLLTSLEYSGVSGFEKTGYRYSISNLEKNSFKLFLPYRTGDGIRLNYCTVYNPSADLSTFQYNGDNTYYKKSYLFSGNLESIAEKIKVDNLNIKNKNSLTFKIPYSQYYINGPLNIKGLFNNDHQPAFEFVETPEVTGILPTSIIAGQSFKILGKSFKRPILLDGTGYDSTNINLKYADTTYLEKDNNLRINCYILDVNTLSGIVPEVNIPPGNYAIQVITEKGDLY